MRTPLTAYAAGRATRSRRADPADTRDADNFHFATTVASSKGARRCRSEEHRVGSTSQDRSKLLGADVHGVGHGLHTGGVVRPDRVCAERHVGVGADTKRSTRKADSLAIRRRSGPSCRWNRDGRRSIPPKRNSRNLRQGVEVMSSRRQPPCVRRYHGKRLLEALAVLEVPGRDRDDLSQATPYRFMDVANSFPGRAQRRAVWERRETHARPRCPCSGGCDEDRQRGASVK